ncbi:response regulator [Phenylobacterium aquaticum]|uniref:response regulator n=1 Tax=Phenylobacterium aquaticum TaxID=1763816 RepID=UPI001F5DF251|nr:response regulator [Phenylobacterium aquaticum]MCI3131687.1 response regulator [Phenylobacterium aquaticum]
MSEQPVRRVLVVEDEAMVAMLIQDLLAELGCQVAMVASTASEAADMAMTCDVDFALLDVNLGRGQTSFQAATILGQRRTPFIWVTGYGRDGVPERFSAAPVISKPIDPNLLADAVRNLG